MTVVGVGTVVAFAAVFLAALHHAASTGLQRMPGHQQLAGGRVVVRLLVAAALAWLVAGRLIEAIGDAGWPLAAFLGYLVARGLEGDPAR